MDLTPKQREQEKAGAALKPEPGRGEAQREGFWDTGETLGTDSVLLVPTQPWKSKKASWRKDQLALPQVGW